MNKTALCLLCIFLTASILASEQDAKTQFDLIPKEKLVETLAASLPTPLVLIDLIAQYCLEEQWIEKEHIPLSYNIITIVQNLSHQPQDKTFAWIGIFEPEHAKTFSWIDSFDEKVVKINFYDITKRQQLNKIAIAFPTNIPTISYNNVYMLLNMRHPLFNPGANAAIWSIEKEKEIKVITEFDSIALSPDDTSIAVGKHKNITISDIESNTILTTLTAPQELEKTPVYSPNGNYLAAISKNRIIIWDLALNKIFRKIKLRTLSDLTFGLKFAPDCKLLTWYYATEDGQVKT